MLDILQHATNNVLACGWLFTCMKLISFAVCYLWLLIFICSVIVDFSFFSSKYLFWKIIFLIKQAVLYIYHNHFITSFVEETETINLISKKELRLYIEGQLPLMLFRLDFLIDENYFSLLSMEWNNISSFTPGSYSLQSCSISLG